MLLALFALLTLAVVGRIGWLAAAGAQANTPQRAMLGAGRADIVDRNGVPLARTIEAWSVGIHPAKVIGDKARLAVELNRLMPEKTVAQYRAILSSGRTFTYLRRRAMPELVAAVNALGEPGMALAREPERLYPQATLAAHVLGYLDFDGRGVTGMERLLDERLLQAGPGGAPVALSIDSRVQAALESELDFARVKHSAIGASGVIVDVRTGEVVAMASQPVYNPNRPGRTAPETLRNNMTQSVYELGSTFKPLTLANAIEHRVVTDLSKKWDASHALAIGRFRITDFKGENRPLTAVEMLVYSSNIVTARVADAVGAERQIALFRRLGFDRPPEIELKEKGWPLFPKDWGRATLLTTGYGHGIAVTPLHLASAYAALVNGGVMRPLSLLKRDPAHLPEGRRVFSEETSRTMRGLLRMVVIDGSGKNANVAGYRIGGKTGTADKNRGGRYGINARVSTFASAFPMDDPRYVVIVSLDEPRPTADTYGYATAGWTAAPIVGRLVPRIGPMLGVFPDVNREADIGHLIPLVWKPKRG
nr:penicillin-binding protein 2 [Sphingomonas jejuensis]